jgi:predicted glutamine amidotransferase
MCIIFYNEKGVPYSERELRNAHRTNDDGVGIMWVENGKVQTYRGMDKADDLVRMMKDFEGVPHALHLRYATNGPVCEDLCHPFKATPDGADMDVYLMHNGVLFEHGARAEPHESDTLVFARDRAQDIMQFSMDTDLLFDDAYIQYLENVISGDRMIFLRDNGDVVVLNTQAWYVDQATGIWYSNRYSIADRPSWSSYSHLWDSFGKDDDDDVSLEKTYSYPGGSRFYGTPVKSAEESAKVLLSENPVISSVEEVFPDGDEDKLLYFRWEGENFIPCGADEADIEVTEKEYFEQWLGESSDDDFHRLFGITDDEEIEWHT